MDNEHTSIAQEEVESIPSRDALPQLLLNVLSAPINLILSFLSATFSALRPFAPQIIPVLICALLVPLVILLSIASGVVVWRNVAVGWDSPVHLQFGDGATPYALSPLPKLVAHQRYDISVRLTIPAIESNFALGNFMTTLTLSTPSNKTLVSVRRPPNTINLNMPMVPSFVPGTSKIVAYVEVGRRDGWKSLGTGEGREISVVSASIRGSIVHHGIRGLVARFPLISAIVSATTFLVILSLILAACILPIVFRRMTPTEVTSLSSEQMIKGLPLSPLSSSSSESDDKPPRRPRSRQSRSTSRRRGGVKTEAPTTIMPRTRVIEEEPLRQRLPRPSDALSDSE
ncbi:hypothetical protein Hypma_015681 [Hypsizygus marmoreus]|uniref:Seipin n=1 Tax=Hypsizygus marmoreus TaxID=39966 RepID=A0A369K8D0_HYPMA|nr:hypothetical protein Hypma_015681 [Hypsizygus marmoreus]